MEDHGGYYGTEDGGQAHFEIPCWRRMRDFRSRGGVKGRSLPVTRFITRILHTDTHTGRPMVLVSVLQSLLLAAALGLALVSAAWCVRCRFIGDRAVNRIGGSRDRPNPLHGWTPTTPPYDSRGPPYLYITYHGGSERGDINNIRIFSRDGCYLGEALQPGRTELNELRGMVEYGDSLLINNANKDSSMVIQYKCACATQSLREMRVMVSSDTPGIDHPYGLAVDNTFLYTTNQCVLCVGQIGRSAPLQ